MLPVRIVVLQLCYSCRLAGTPIITRWKLQELWGTAVVPALQGLGLGLDLAFPSAYSTLETVRINTKIILTKLKKLNKTHTHTKRENAHVHDRCKEMESKSTNLHTLEKGSDGGGEL